MEGQSICQACRGLSIETLAKDEGHRIAASGAELLQNADTCLMCKLLNSSLEKKDENAVVSDESVVCRFSVPNEAGVVVMEVRAGPRKGAVNVYTTDMQDPAASHFVQVKPRMDSENLAALTDIIAAHAVQMCLDDHKCTEPFRKPSSSDESTASDVPRLAPLDTVPSRLISLADFGDDETADAKLVALDLDSKAPGEPGFYAALSYCWGSNVDAMYKTELATVQDRANRIRFDELPKTFQDAFRIARRLHIPFLWIDAICIIQDDLEDWERESVRMGGIYASSTVTIAADVSDGVDGGILDLVSPEDSLEQPGSVRITNKLSSDQESSLVFYNTYTGPPGTTWTPQTIVDSPLSKRAWCMQERMLSPRTLHFTRQGPVWECRVRYFIFARTSTFDEMYDIKTFASVPRLVSEGLPRGAWRDALPAVEFMAGGDSTTEEQLEMINAVLQTNVEGNWLAPGAWAKETQEMSPEERQKHLVPWWNRNVVVPFSERRITFASDRLPAISGIAKLFAEHIKAPYLAGLWLAELDEGLEWKRSGPIFNDTRLPGHPSFSWASHPGPVMWTYQFDMRGYGSGFEIVDHQICLAGMDAHGRVERVELTLRGRIRHAGLGAIEEKNDEVHGDLLDQEERTVGKAELDFIPDENRLSRGVECFLLYRNSVKFPRVLLLVPVEGDDALKSYQRVGVGSINVKDAAWLEATDKSLVKLI